jgi:hypothetical protein
MVEAKRMNMKFDTDEINRFVDWLFKMAKFWSFSALLYFAVINGSTVAWWVIGSLVVLYAADYWYGAKERDFEDDKDNRH